MCVSSQPDFLMSRSPRRIQFPGTVQLVFVAIVTFDLWINARTVIVCLWRNLIFLLKAYSVVVAHSVSFRFVNTVLGLILDACWSRCQKYVLCLSFGSLVFCWGKNLVFRGAGVLTVTVLSGETVRPSTPHCFIWVCSLGAVCLCKGACLCVCLLAFHGHMWRGE